MPTGRSGQVWGGRGAAPTQLSEQQRREHHSPMPSRPMGAPCGCALSSVRSPDFSRKRGNAHLYVKFLDFNMLQLMELFMKTLCWPTSWAQHTSVAQQAVCNLCLCPHHQVRICSLALGSWAHLGPSSTAQCQGSERSHWPLRPSSAPSLARPQWWCLG